MEHSKKIQTQILFNNNKSRNLSSLSKSKRRSTTTILQLSSEDSTWNEAKPKVKQLVNASKVSAYIEISKTPEFQFRTVVFFLFVLIIALLTTTSFLKRREQNLKTLRDKLLIIEEERKLILLNSDSDKLLSLHFGMNIPHDLNPFHCHTLNKNKSLDICLDWNHRAHFNIDHYHLNKEISCYHIKWTSYTSDNVLKDCIDLGDGYWYGMGEIYKPSWPLNKLNLKKAPFVTNTKPDSSSPFGALIKRYWLSTKGVNLMIPLEIPIYISFNSSESGKHDKLLCLESFVSHYPYDYIKGFYPVLDYTICTGPDIIELHSEVSKTWVNPVINKSQEVQDMVLESVFIEKPIWIIDERLMSDLNLVNLDNYSTDIINYRIEPGFLLLDSRWQKHIGDLTMNKEAFPNPNQHFTMLSRKGFRIMLSVTPLIDIYSEIFEKALLEKRVISDPHLNVPLLTQCYVKSFKLCAVLDLMNSTTRKWFKERLKQLKSYSIHGFFFEGLQVSRIPRFGFTNISVINPDYFQVHYNNVIGSSFDLIGIDTTANWNGSKGFYKMLTLNSTWEALRMVIPSVLSLNFIGYPIVNSGSVGGDVYNDSELYIRWFELATFLPILQLSDIPRNQISIIKLAKRCIHIREREVIPIMKKYIIEYYIHGWPLIRPIWWLDPSIEQTYLIDDQFAIGNDILVAPILNKGRTSRDIYLPGGWWKDEMIGTVVRGGRWIRNYSVDLKKIAYFTRTDSNAN